MTLDRLSQITEVGIKSGITLNGINVIGVVTATSLTVNGGAVVNGVVTATSFSGNVTGNITPTGLVVSGVSTFQASSFWGDGDIAYFGDGQDLLIFHNSTDSIIRDNGTGDLFIEGGNVIRMTNPTGIETYATFNQNAAVELYYDNAKKFETTSGGASITGDLVVSGIITSGTSTITIDGPNNSITVGSAFIKNNSIGIGTTTTAGKNAGIGTAVGTLVYDSNLNRLEVYTPVGWAKAAEESFTVTVSPGSITANTGRSGYIYYTFTGPGSFVITGAPGTLEYLVVGGGGAGGNTSGGGGGAGGFVTGTFTNLGPGTYTVQVGGGGVSPATNGTPSYITNPGITSATAQGGGLGGGFNTAGGPGGSGGGGGSRVPGGANGGFPGGSGNKVTGTPTASTPNTQGSNGGDGYAQPASYSGGGGGGGAGGAGGQGGPYPGQAGNGGPGQPSSITGSSVLYAGGGGGGSELMAAGAAGPGGGGAGARFADGPGQPNPGATAGTANKGGGGGGGHITHANGGSGVVIIAYPTA
jgi:hypothetical protein